MVQLNSSAFYGQEAKIRIVLVLRHTENFPSFQVQNEFSMTEVLFMSSFILQRRMVSKFDESKVKYYWHCC